MNTLEFSMLFDVLYNNIMSNRAPGLNEYEKSLFLTKAQDEIVKNYFRKENNDSKKGFDEDQKRQVDFSKLLSIKTLDATTVSSDFKLKNTIDSRSKLYEWPNDVLFAVNEMAVVKDAKQDTNIIVIVPITYLEYASLMSKPYKQPLRDQGWRLLNTYNGKTIAEVIVNIATTLEKYTLKYVRYPNPIILEDLSLAGVSINGKTAESTCELDPVLHQEILQRAVELAKASFDGDIKTSLEVGKRSE